MMKFYLRFSLFFLIHIFFLVSAQGQSDSPIERVDPPFWWNGMKIRELQILVYGKNIGHLSTKLKHKDVKLMKEIKADNPNYLFLYLYIGPRAKAGNFDIHFTNSDGAYFSYQYTLKERVRSPERQQGVNSSDVIYLITPDRFANGDLKNDIVEGMRESRLDRRNPGGRHGGDLKGIMNHLDYIKALGPTTIWLNPVIENDMDEYSYHGYAITDFYKVDPRHGTNEDYTEFVKLTHDKGMKVIMDMIFNHCGLKHWWMKDLPFSDWINHQGEHFQQTFHNGQAISDPYAAQHDIDRIVKGWFVETMPDLNQRNSHLATYLIQNSIWWIEFAGIDGIRMDTYYYPYREMLSRWAQTVLEEYPRFYIVGEIWLPSSEYDAYPSPAYESYWKTGRQNADGYNSHIQSISDFPFFYATNETFGKNRKQKIRPIYELLTKDFLYSEPQQNKIFLDNHDTDRFYYTTGKDMNKFKMGLIYLMTTRGIPQFYYGTEILMSGHEDHGLIREDFPGGWKTDPNNAFHSTGRTKHQNEAFNFVKKLLNWRKNEPLIHTGKLTHFVPQNECYVYARHNGQKTILIVLNNHKEKEAPLDTDRFKEVLKNYTKATEIHSKKKFENMKDIVIPAQTGYILELRN